MSIFLPCKIHLWCISPSDTEQIRAGYSLFNSILCASVWDYRYHIATSNRSLWNKKSRHHFIFSLSLSQIYQRNCISSASGKKWVKYWFQRLSTHWYYLLWPCSAHWRFGGDIVPDVFFSLLWGAVLRSDYSSIHNCLAPLITGWNGPHVVCQVSIVVSQGLNTFNNLISTSAPFVHVEKESPSRRFVSLRGGPASTRLSPFLSNWRKPKHLKEVNKYELK